MANKFFGTDGVRGVANTYPMTIEFASKLAQACAEFICKDKKIVAIAKDTRVSGDMIESALCAGFTSMGIDVIRLGIMPTPALTAITAFLDVDMSLMITASHNPYYDNGIKLINAEGNKLSDEQTKEIEAKIIEDNFICNKDKIGRVYSNFEAINHYIEMIKTITKGLQPLKGLRVVLDCANGAFFEIMPEIYKQLGAGVITIANEPDGYNINKDCGSQHTEKLVETVINAKAHIGIAADGDGDRIVVCDELGNKIAGEQLMAFLAKYMLDNDLMQTKALVSTILSNTGLESYAKSIGLDYYSTNVGERYVIEKMQEIGACVGGEESGHLVVSNYGKTGDVLAVSLIVCLGLIKSGKKMSEIFPMFEMEPFEFVNLKFADKEKLKQAMEDSIVKDAVANAENKLKNIGRVVVRLSGTEPLIRIWVCGKDKNLVKELSSDIVNKVKAHQ